MRTVFPYQVDDRLKAAIGFALGRAHVAITQAPCHKPRASI
jgi:hypothetical protein